MGLRNYHFFPTLKNKDIHNARKYLSINLDTGIFFISPIAKTRVFSGNRGGLTASSAFKKSAWMVR